MENQLFHRDISNTHSQVSCTSEIDSRNDNLTASNAARALGSRPAIFEFLSQVESLGLGLFLNRKKCELFWPSGDQSFFGFRDSQSFQWT